MAKKRKSGNIVARKKNNSSVLTKNELRLDKHDEEKVILFAAGMLFGIGIAGGILGSVVYSGFVAIVLALVLLFVEARQ